MRIIFIVIFLFFLPEFCFSQPSIVFDKEKHDAGFIQYRDTIQHTFKFTNAGDEDLIIEELLIS
jgi:hypothetical protein